MLLCGKSKINNKTIPVIKYFLISAVGKIMPNQLRLKNALLQFTKNQEDLYLYIGYYL
jgi:hypothetical protein